MYRHLDTITEYVLGYTNLQANLYLQDITVCILFINLDLSIEVNMFQWSIWNECDLLTGDAELFWTSGPNSLVICGFPHVLNRKFWKSLQFWLNKDKQEYNI